MARNKAAAAALTRAAEFIVKYGPHHWERYGRARAAVRQYASAAKIGYEQAVKEVKDEAEQLKSDARRVSAKR